MFILHYAFRTLRERPVLPRRSFDPTTFNRTQL
ncbi:hypothetical protein CMEL01_12636 [Colletotrichum melonis]|uniref:Uncharacterized protein n=2 Tax=Colletotrichum acutatum species complex TaxID=2707335 RepID=A0AAI9XUW2_9PEZI|nr:hypothetical protein CMEL01_12636 [Colletotrichum melonis]